MVHWQKCLFSSAKKRHFERPEPRWDPKNLVKHPPKWWGRHLAHSFPFSGEYEANFWKFHILGLSGALFPLPWNPNFIWSVQWHLWVYKFETALQSTKKNPIFFFDPGYSKINVTAKNKILKNQFLALGGITSSIFGSFGLDPIYFLAIIFWVTSQPLYVQNWLNVSKSAFLVVHTFGYPPVMGALMTKWCTWRMQWGGCNEDQDATRIKM